MREFQLKIGELLTEAVASEINTAERIFAKRSGVVGRDVTAAGSKPVCGKSLGKGDRNQQQNRRLQVSQNRWFKIDERMHNNKNHDG
jgi:hypothetical protein